VKNTPSPYPLPPGERGTKMKSKRNFLPLEGGRCEKIKKWELCLLISLENFRKNPSFTNFFTPSGR
jgi:hypothetical protein